MKNIVLVFALLLCATLALGQGNLQFNQVRKFQWTATTPINSLNYHVMGPFVVTVPVGKVLKVESMSVSTLRVPALSASGIYGAANNTPASIWLEETCIHANPGTTATFQDHMSNQIVWLPEGTHNFYIGAQALNSAAINNFAATITSIEFNIVP